MLKLIINILVLVIISLTFNYLHQESGYFILNIGKYEIETSLVIGFVIISGAVFVSLYMFKVASFLSYLIFRKGSYDIIRRYKKVLREISSTLNAIALNDAKHAKKSIVKLGKYIKSESTENLVNILSYQVAKVSGDKHQEKFYLSRLKGYHNTKIMAFKELVNLELESGNLQVATDLAESIAKDKPNLKGIFPFLLLIYKKTENFEKAIEILTDAKQQGRLKNRFNFKNKNYYRKDIADININKELASMLNAFVSQALFSSESVSESSMLKLTNMAKKAVVLDKNNLQHQILLAEIFLKTNQQAKAQDVLKEVLKEKERGDVLKLLIEIEKTKPSSTLISHYEERLKKISGSFGYICLNCFETAQNYSVACKNCESVDEIAFVDDVTPYKLISKKHLDVATKN